MKIPRRFATDLWLLKHVIFDLRLTSAALFATPFKTAISLSSTLFRRLLEMARSVGSAMTSMVFGATMVIVAIFSLLFLVFYCVGSVAIAISPSLVLPPLVAIAPASPPACAKMENLLRGEQAALNKSSFLRLGLPMAKEASLASWLPAAAGNAGPSKAAFCHQDSQGSFIMLAQQQKSRPIQNGAAGSGPTFPSERAAILLRQAGAEGSTFKLTERPPRSARLFLELTGIAEPTEASRSMWLASGSSAREAGQTFDPSQGVLSRVATAFWDHPWVASIGFIVIIFSTILGILGTAGFFLLFLYDKRRLFSYNGRRNSPRRAVVEARQENRQPAARIAFDRLWLARRAKLFFEVASRLLKRIGLALVFCLFSILVGFFVKALALGDGDGMWTHVSSQRCASASSLNLPILAPNGDVIHASCRIEPDGPVLVATLSSRPPSSLRQSLDAWHVHLEALVPGAKWRDAHIPQVSQWGAAAAELLQWSPPTGASRLVAHRVGWSSHNLFVGAFKFFFIGVTAMFSLCVVGAMIFFSARLISFAAQRISLAALSSLRHKASNPAFLSRAELRELSRSTLPNHAPPQTSTSSARGRRRL